MEFLHLEYWFLTCAELGLLAGCGYCDVNHSYAKFPQAGTFNEMGFLLLPYGTFKEHDGWIKAIKAYTGPKTNLVGIKKDEGYLEMINTLGCLEIINENIATPSEAVPEATISEILIKFHSNLEQLGGTGGIEDDWHLIGKIGSSDYKWKNKSG